jgi:hypothetical protein
VGWHDSSNVRRVWRDVCKDIHMAKTGAEVLAAINDPK